MKPETRAKIVTMAADHISQFGTIGHETNTDGSWTIEVDGESITLSEQESESVILEAFDVVGQ